MTARQDLKRATKALRQAFKRVAQEARSGANGAKNQITVEHRTNAIVTVNQGQSGTTQLASAQQSAPIQQGEQPADPARP